MARLKRSAQSPPADVPDELQMLQLLGTYDQLQRRDWSCIFDVLVWDDPSVIQHKSTHSLYVMQGMKE